MGGCFRSTPRVVIDEWRKGRGLIGARVSHHHFIKISVSCNRKLTFSDRAMPFNAERLVNSLFGILPVNLLLANARNSRSVREERPAGIFPPIDVL